MSVGHYRSLSYMPRLVYEDLGEAEEIPPGCQGQSSEPGLDLHRSVLHTDLPVPYCFDCKSAACQERQETVGYIVIIMLLIDRMGVCYSVSLVSFMW